MLAFLLQYCADANVTRVARYDLRFRRIRQLQHWGAFDGIFEVLKIILLPSPPFRRPSLSARIVERICGRSLGLIGGSGSPDVGSTALLLLWLSEANQPELGPCSAAFPHHPDPLHGPGTAIRRG
jgi:hypothetical protein